jgi:hypothetical protein
MKTAIIIGCNRQGEKYVRALGVFAAQYDINRVIVTRTNKAAAEETAQRLSTPGLPILGEAVQSVDEAIALFAEHQPCFIGITAKDPQTTHDIHVPYALAAARYGPTLIEKPFANPSDDQHALAQIAELERIAQFPVGLELTYLPVARNIWTNFEISELYKRYATLDCYVVSRPLGDTRPDEDILGQLFVHAASLIPETENCMLKSATVSPRKSTITYTTPTRTITLHLAYGGNYSGFKIGPHHFCIKRFPDHVSILRLRDTFTVAKTLALSNDAMTGQLYLYLEHPLQTHMMSMLQGKPIAGFPEMVRSQTLLEDAYAKRKEWP